MLSTLVQLGLPLAQAGMNYYALQQEEETYADQVNQIMSAGRENARRAKFEGKLDLYKYNFKARQVRGQQLAGQAAGGGALTGSYLQVAAMQEQNNEFNRDLIEYKAGLRSRNALIDAANGIVQARGSIQNARIATAGSLLSIGNQAYFNWNQERLQRNYNTINASNARERLAYEIKILKKKIDSNYNTGGSS